MEKKEQNLLNFIIYLAIIGFFISSYALAHHDSFVSGSFCTIGSSFNCDIVNRGPYSEIYGLPVALIGIIGYFFLAAAAFMKKKWPRDKGISFFLLLSSGGGLVFSGYLTSLEAFVLKAWCLICVSSAAIMVLIFLSSLFVWFKHKKYPQTDIF